jgi:hypothetical protein
MEFGVDDLVCRRHRRERPVLDDCLPMKGNSIGWAQPQE